MKIVIDNEVYLDEQGRELEFKSIDKYTDRYVCTTESGEKIKLIGINASVSVTGGEVTNRFTKEEELQQKLSDLQDIITALV